MYKIGKIKTSLGELIIDLDDITIEEAQDLCKLFGLKVDIKSGKLTGFSKDE